MTLADTEPTRANDPDPFAEKRADIDQRLAAFLEGANVWEQRTELDDALAARANDFIAGAKQLLKEAEEARKAEGQPHREAIAAINQSWDAIKSRIEKVIGIVAPKLDAHLKAKREEARRQKEEAERKAREAEEARRAAEADAAAARNAAARIEAEERAAEQARIAEEAAARAKKASAPVRVESATGLANRRGLRTERKPVITSMAQALTHYRAEPELEALILKLAARDLREAPTRRGVKQIPQIPGIDWKEEQVLA